MREKKIKILETKKITDNKFVNLFSRKYVDKAGNEKDWIFASRKEKQNDKKIADAVVIVPILDEDKLVVTSEYRIAVDKYEIGFPAGLIEDGEDVWDTVRRELKEETGLEFNQSISYSPPIYSSIGMSDESVIIVFAKCYGTISTKNNEDSEDIIVSNMSQDEVRMLLDGNKVIDFICNKDYVFGAKAWTILRRFADTGRAY